MANDDNYSETNEVQSHSDFIGIETKPMSRPPVNDNQLDDLSTWAMKGQYSINQMALLMAGISPFKCGSIESAYTKGYSDFQLEVATVIQSSILDGLFNGDLTAFRIMAISDYDGSLYQVDFSRLLNLGRRDISLDETTIQQDVLFAWIKRKQYKSVRRRIIEYNTTASTQARILLPNEYSTPAIDLLKDHVEQNLIGADDNYLCSVDGLKQQKQYLEVNGKRMGLVDKEIKAIHTVARSPLATEKYTKHHAQGKTPEK